MARAVAEKWQMRWWWSMVWVLGSLVVGYGAKDMRGEEEEGWGGLGGLRW